MPGRRIFEQLERGVERLADAFALVAVFSLVLLTVVVTYSVMMRYVFNRPQIWTDELATYCLAAIVFFGLAHTLARGGHIRVDVLTDRLPARPRAYLEAVVHLFGVAFCVLFALAGWSAVENYIRRNTYSTGGLDIPLYVPTMILLVGALLFLLLMLCRAARALTSLRRPD